MPASQIIAVLVFSALGFASAWRKLGGYGYTDNQEFRKLPDGKYAPGLQPLPFHLRLALSLISALLAAVAVALFYNMLTRFGLYTTPRRY
jgi:hypothetical protein